MNLLTIGARGPQNKWLGLRATLDTLNKAKSNDTENPHSCRCTDQAKHLVALIVVLCWWKMECRNVMEYLGIWDTLTIQSKVISVILYNISTKAHFANRACQHVKVPCVKQASPFLTFFLWQSVAAAASFFAVQQNITNFSSLRVAF